jgi:hypothetical protein
MITLFYSPNAGADELKWLDSANANEPGVYAYHSFCDDGAKMCEQELLEFVPSNKREPATDMELTVIYNIDDEQLFNGEPITPHVRFVTLF